MRQYSIELMTVLVRLYRERMRSERMANEVVKVERPPLPAIGKISGLGPGLSAIREGMANLRREQSGLTEDIAAYGAAVSAVRDHVRDLHSDLAFEVTDKGNGAGGTVSSEKVEAAVKELVGSSDVGKAEEVITPPLPAGPPAGT